MPLTIKVEYKRPTKRYGARYVARANGERSTIRIPATAESSDLESAFKAVIVWLRRNRLDNNYPGRMKKLRDINNWKAIAWGDDTFFEYPDE